jgi:hypothetical protein
MNFGEGLEGSVVNQPDQFSGILYRIKLPDLREPVFRDRYYSSGHWRVAPI